MSAGHKRRSKAIPCEQSGSLAEKRRTLFENSISKLYHSELCNWDSSKRVPSRVPGSEPLVES